MTDAKETARVFVGVRVSMATVKALTGAVESLRSAAEATGLRARWVAPASYHVTLKFLGWTRVEAIPAIVDELADELEGISEFEFDCRGLGLMGTVR